MNGQFAAWFAQDAAHAFVQPKPIRGEVELVLRDLPGIDRRGDVLGGHETDALTCRAVGPPSV